MYHMVSGNRYIEATKSCTVALKNNPTALGRTHAYREHDSGVRQGNADVILEEDAVAQPRRERNLLSRPGGVLVATEQRNDLQAAVAPLGDVCDSARSCSVKCLAATLTHPPGPGRRVGAVGACGGVDHRVLAARPSDHTSDLAVTDGSILGVQRGEASKFAVIEVRSRVGMINGAALICTSVGDGDVTDLTVGEPRLRSVGDCDVTDTAVRKELLAAKTRDDDTRDGCISHLQFHDRVRNFVL